MKKILSLASLISALALSSSGVASTMYSNGVFEPTGLTLTDLANDGWTTVINTPYGNPVNNLGIQGSVAGAYVFVGAADENGNIVMGATGLTSQVLSETFSYSTATSYASSNLKWYNVSGASFGFTATSNIYLTSADATGIFTADDGMNDFRLSWHDQGGGWRAGSHIWLNSDSFYHKIVLTSNSANAVPDSASTLSLMGAAMIGLCFVRRFKRA